MRAQFATVEALISLLAILSTISLVSGSISLNSSSVHAAQSKVVQGMAVYDAAEQIAGNVSTNECVALAHETGDASCLNGIIESYKEAFGLRHFGLAFPGISVGNATGNDTSECVPIEFASLNGTEEVCIMAGN